MLSDQEIGVKVKMPQRLNGHAQKGMIKPTAPLDPFIVATPSGYLGSVPLRLSF